MDVNYVLLGTMVTVTGHVAGYISAESRAAMAHIRLSTTQRIKVRPDRT